jgi:UDP-glucose 4-epimerase
VRRTRSIQPLVTGATGKVGVNLIERLLSDPRWRVARVRALCHSRSIAETDRIEVVKGSIEDRDCLDHAMRDVTHVVHLATCKEIPETAMDVTVKGLFWLLEVFRQSTKAKQFMLIGGDEVGHFFYDHQEPITEHTPHRTGPVWNSLVAPEVAKRCQAEGTVPLLRDARDNPLKRNFVRVEDLVAAILAALDNPLTGNKLYNICMDEPVDYGGVAAFLKMGPRYDLVRLIDAAWTYRREPGDSGKVWYPG